MRFMKYFTVFLFICVVSDGQQLEELAGRSLTNSDNLLNSPENYSNFKSSFSVGFESSIVKLSNLPTLSPKDIILPKNYFANRKTTTKSPVITSTKSTKAPRKTTKHHTVISSTENSRKSAHNSTRPTHKAKTRPTFSSKSHRTNIPKSHTNELLKSHPIELPETHWTEIPKTTRPNIPKTLPTLIPKTPPTDIPKTHQTNIPNSHQINIPKTAPIDILKTDQINIPKSPLTEIPKTYQNNVPKTPPNEIPTTLSVDILRPRPITDIPKTPTEIPKPDVPETLPTQNIVMITPISVPPVPKRPVPTGVPVVSTTKMAFSDSTTSLGNLMTSFTPNADENEFKSSPEGQEDLMTSSSPINSTNAPWDELDYELLFTEDLSSENSSFTSTTSFLDTISTTTSTTTHFSLPSTPLPSSRVPSTSSRATRHFSFSLTPSKVRISNLIKNSVLPLVTIGNKFYHLQKDMKVNFLGAFQFCRKHGMDLLSIEGREEEEAIANFLNESKISEVWTSGTDLSEEGNFVWLSTGKVFDYVAWGPNQPDNVGSIEDCVQMVLRPLFSENYSWEDVICDFPAYFICELPACTDFCMNNS